MHSIGYGDIWVVSTTTPWVLLVIVRVRFNFSSHFMFREIGFFFTLFLLCQTFNLLVIIRHVMSYTDFFALPGWNRAVSVALSCFFFHGAIFLSDSFSMSFEVSHLMESDAFFFTTIIAIARVFVQLKGLSGRLFVKWSFFTSFFCALDLV